jgi:hypothetical protein
VLGLPAPSKTASLGAGGANRVLCLFQGQHPVIIFRASLTPLVLARPSRPRAPFGPHRFGSAPRPWDPC